MRRTDLPKVIVEMKEVVHAAALKPELWQEVADRLWSRAGAKITMQVWDRGVSHAQPLIVAGWSDQAVEKYAAYYGLINPWKQTWIDMPFMQASWTDDYLPNSELRGTECYADFLRLEKADGGTGIKLIDEPDSLAIFSFNYDGAKGERSNFLLQPLLQGLATSMRQAIDVNRTVYRSSPCGTVGADLLSALVDPAFVVDGDSRLLAANASAQRMIADGALLRVGARDVLQIADPQVELLFSERIRRACHPHFADDQTAIDDLVINHPSGNFAITMMLVRQNFHSMTLGGVLPLLLPTTVLLVVMRPRQKRTMSEKLRGRYGLTEAESAVALALLTSDTLAQAADRLGVSYETVRSHLRAVFIKTGTNRQKQLVALMIRLTGGSHHQ